jgi:hypothetical protein
MIFNQSERSERLLFPVLPGMVKVKRGSVIYKPKFIPDLVKIWKRLY